MNEVVEATLVLKEYVTVQGKLCVALFTKYGDAKDRYLTNIPLSGLLELEGEVWNFKKHGLGVLFERLSDHSIVDVHRHIDSCPMCVDPWRLVQYLESKQILRLNVGAKIFDAQDEKSLGDMLDELLRVGKAVQHENGGICIDTEI